MATHGKVTDVNAHPHPSTSGSIAIVHYGIIENFEKQKELEENAGKIKEISDIYILGRGVHYLIAIEAVLKLKELT